MHSGVPRVYSDGKKIQSIDNNDLKCKIETCAIGYYRQTAGISIRAFYKLGTEPLPMGLEKLILKSHQSERHGLYLFGSQSGDFPGVLRQIKAPRKLCDWLIARVSPSESVAF